MRRTALFVSMLLLLVPLASWSESGSECPEWFPDFSCDDREGRPEGFVTPTSMPYYFEDPFITTEISTHLLWHDFPWDSVFRGGDIWVLAVQARLAQTDRLAFIATKDGYAWMRPGSHSQIRADEGFFDLAAGFKYQAIRNEETGLVVTPALRFVIPAGNSAVFSGKGKGAIIPSASAALPLGPINAIGNLGLFQPFNDNVESSFMFANIHLSTSVLEFVVPFAELNGQYWTRSGNGRNHVDTRSFGKVDLGTAQTVLHGAGVTDRQTWEGADAVNLGSSGVSGNQIMTLALGGRIPITKKASFAAYWETPITNRKDIWEQRVGLNLAYAF
ncbi:MAG: hypothetical protein ACQGVC_13970 [Myxococcota bacterium]